MAYRKTEHTLMRNARRREQILDAARRMFSIRGYKETTMNQIVSEAHTSIGNCYFYFPNKEAILMEIVREIIDRLWTFPVTHEENTGAGAAKLARILYESVIAMIREDDIARLMIIGESVPSVRCAMIEEFSVRLRKIIDDDPLFDTTADIDLDMFATQGALFALLERKRSGVIERSPDQIGRFFVRFVLRAMGLPPEDVDRTVAAIGIPHCPA